MFRMNITTWTCLFLVFITNVHGFTILPNINLISPVTSKSYSTVITDRIELSTGISAEYMVCTPKRADPSSSNLLENLWSLFNKVHSIPKPPLIFIHGSFHASWCWAEHYMPYFADRGYSSYALSLRGTGGTYAGDGVKKVRIENHVEDLTAFIDFVKVKENFQKPILISHSFGGLLVMKYLESIANCKINTSVSEFKDKNISLPISGVVLMCSVPPSGNGKMTMRFLKRSIRDSWKITAGLAMKKCITDKKLCRELFFDPFGEDRGRGISDEDIEVYQGYFMRDSVATIDLFDLSKKLPSLNLNDKGQAAFCDALPPSLIIGASDDFIVDREGVEETARYFGMKPIFIPSAHDVMLGERWENGAKAIEQWLIAI